MTLYQIPLFPYTRAFAIASAFAEATEDRTADWRKEGCRMSPTASIGFDALFAIYPRHQKIDDSLLLPGGNLNPARNFPPLGETIATAAGASVLGFEHGMSAHRRLFAVIRWIRRGEPSPYKVFAMATNGRQPLLGDVLPVRSRKMEPAPELRLRQPRKS